MDKDLEEKISFLEWWYFHSRLDFTLFPQEVLTDIEKDIYIKITGKKFPNLY
jgi:hypothetical protein